MLRLGTTIDVCRFDVAALPLAKWHYLEGRHFSSTTGNCDASSKPRAPFGRERALAAWRPSSRREVHGAGTTG